MNVSAPTDLFVDGFVETHQVGDVCVTLIDARVLTDHQVEAAKRRLCDLAAAHGGRMAVSLSNTVGSSMSLFAALLFVQQRCERDGGRMVLFDVPPMLIDALSRFGLVDNFTLAADLAEAADAVHRRSRVRASWLTHRAAS